MKNFMMSVILFSGLSSTVLAQSKPIEDVIATIHANSGGQLIEVRISFVRDAKGDLHWFDHQGYLNVSGSRFCDLVKPWSLVDKSIFCVAK